MKAKRSGYVMLIVMMLILTTTALAAVHTRQLNAALRIEQARMRSEERAQGPVHVLAVACQRLETGEPPEDEIDYQYTHTGATGTMLYRVSYEEDGDDRWIVTAEPDTTAASLDALPDAF